MPNGTHNNGHADRSKILWWIITGLTAAVFGMTSHHVTKQSTHGERITRVETEVQSIKEEIRGRFDRLERMLQK